MRKSLIIFLVFAASAFADNPKIVLVDEFQSNDRTKTWFPPPVSDTLFGLHGGTLVGPLSCSAHNSFGVGASINTVPSLGSGSYINTVFENLSSPPVGRGVATVSEIDVSQESGSPFLSEGGYFAVENTSGTTVANEQLAAVQGFASNASAATTSLLEGGTFSASNLSGSGTVSNLFGLGVVSNNLSGSGPVTLAEALIATAINGSGSAIVNNRAVQATATNSSSGSVTTQIVENLTSNNTGSGTITTAALLNLNVNTTNTAVTTNSIAMDINTPNFTGSSSGTSLIGLEIDDQGTSHVTTTNNFFSNATTATKNLNITGSSPNYFQAPTKFDGLLTANGDLSVNGEWKFSLSTTQFEPAPNTPSFLFNVAAMTPNNGSVVFGIQDFTTDIAPADLYVQTGAQTTVGSTNSTGELFLYSGPITDTGASGNTGATVLFTGDNSGSGGSGGLFLNSGNTQSGASGPVVIQSGGVAVGPSSNSGTVFITTGGINAGVGASGSITLQTGDSNAGGNSGDITFQTGVASVTRGTVHFNAKAVDAGSVLINNVTDPSSAQDAATKNYVDTNFIKTTSAAGFFLPLSSGPLTSIVTNEIIGTGKAVRATTVENIEASAAEFTCLTNPTLTLLDCGASAGACTSGTTALGSVTLTGANSITDGTVSVSSIAAGHYWAWQITAGSCTALNVIGSAEGKMQ